MGALTWLFDGLLGLTLLALALGISMSRNLYQSVVMFIVFGLLVALSWARLQATDIALAEAAIGAGITGALFLNTIGRIRAIQKQQGDENAPPLDKTS